MPNHKSLWPRRDSLVGICFYYLTLVGLILACVTAWLNMDIKLGFLALSLFGLLFMQDFVWYKHCSFADQDRRLIEKLSNVLSERNIQELLTEYDFRHCHYSTIPLEPLQAIQHQWIGVDYEFTNPRYQYLWDDFRTSLATLLGLLLNEAKYHNAYLRYLHPEKDEPPSERDLGSEANLSAAEVYRLYQEFRAIYIDKMPYQ